MTLLAELKDRKIIYVYKPFNCSLYKLQSFYNLEIEIDDFYIDRHNRIYLIIGNKVYAMRNEYIEIVASFYDFKFINSDYGCTIFWIEERIVDNNNGKVFNYALMFKDLNDSILPETLIQGLEHENYKLLMINKKAYILYYRDVIIIQYKEKLERINLPFIIVQVCYLDDRLVFLDEAMNIQIYNLTEMQLTSGFKALGNTRKIISSQFNHIISLLTEDAIICIDVKNRTILKKKALSEFPFGIRDFMFVDRRTLLLIGDGICEFNLADNNSYLVVETKENSSYRYFCESQGYILNVEFNNKNQCKCKCYEMVLQMKIELRREAYRLNEEIKELKGECKTLKNELNTLRKEDGV